MHLVHVDRLVRRTSMGEPLRWKPSSRPSTMKASASAACIALQNKILQHARCPHRIPSCEFRNNAPCALCHSELLRQQRVWLKTNPETAKDVNDLISISANCSKAWLQRPLTWPLPAGRSVKWVPCPPRQPPCTHTSTWLKHP